ncbi:MAG: YkgJ family cysteine cluster protein [Thermodesulfobacteriota bacterium]|nr:YkgJ family cysteine cluster protein [Thermodesulfobacteriota bacterium]
MTRTECERCGQCCEKGGPALHHWDMDLFERGVIKYRHVYTLRKGELVYDQFKDALVPLEREIVKVKGQGRTWTCIFYDKEDHACSIYKHRPLECVALKCWDLRELEEVYDRDRIARSPLVPEKSAMGEIIADHEKRCAVSLLGELSSALETDRRESAKEAIETLSRYDQAVRDLMRERAGLEPEDLDFFFGRPVSRILRQFSAADPLKAAG